ncbi:hypothetical protein AB0N88_10925 [Streptomyces sp. NPDC093516]|uniref:hypothetical protein n=1 Tax=Streptomyces sp. NPDC093516 TaxID=3155304 RepID=UPI00341A5CAF
MTHFPGKRSSGAEGSGTGVAAVPGLVAALRPRAIGDARAAPSARAAPAADRWTGRPHGSVSLAGGTSGGTSGGADGEVVTVTADGPRLTPHRARSHTAACPGRADGRGPRARH